MIDLEKLEFTPYTKLFLPLITSSDFDCGNTELNNFLKEDVDGHSDEKITCTYLISYEGKLIGYFTLQADSIDLEENERAEFKVRGIPYKTFPAIKIGRLGIDKKYQHKKVGTTTIHVIIGIVRNLCKTVACRFITVDAKNNAKTVKFYESLGFVKNLANIEGKESISYRFDLFNPSKQTSQFFQSTTETKA